jgi:hypothetical protein
MILRVNGYYECLVSQMYTEYLIYPTKTMEKSHEMSSIVYTYILRPFKQKIDGAVLLSTPHLPIFPNPGIPSFRPQ